MEDYCALCGKEIWGKEDIFMHKIVRVYHYDKRKGEYTAEETEEEYALCCKCDNHIQEIIREEMRLGVKHER